MNLSTFFRDLPLIVEMVPLWLMLMNYVPFAFTWTLVQLAVRSRIMKQEFGLGRCICQMHNVISVVHIPNRCVGHRQFLIFANVKPFSFIKSIDVRSTLSQQIINRYGATVSLYSTPVTMSKTSVFLSNPRIFILVFSYSFSMGVMFSFGDGRRGVFASFSL